MFSLFPFSENVSSIKCGGMTKAKNVDSAFHCIKIPTEKRTVNRAVHWGIKFHSITNRNLTINSPILNKLSIKIAYNDFKNRLKSWIAENVWAYVAVSLSNFNKHFSSKLIYVLTIFATFRNKSPRP